MSIMYISATQARREFFELLKRVYYKGEEVVVLVNKKPMVRLVKPEKENPFSQFKPIIRLGKKLSKKQALKDFREAKEFDESL